MMTDRTKIYSRAEIVREYNEASMSGDEFAKVKWASQEKMINRFLLVMNEVPFSRVSSWLDVGCGTGAFQALVRDKFPKIQAVAIDISPNLLSFAQQRKDTVGTEFILSDFQDVQGRSFDLITSIGVLQKTTFSVNDFFGKAFALMRDSGYLFVDTKHIGWKAFKQAGFFPELDHEWFSVNELADGARSKGFVVEKIMGFLPGENIVVLPEESHTIFVVARKGSAL